MTTPGVGGARQTLALLVSLAITFGSPRPLAAQTPDTLTAGPLAPADGAGRSRREGLLGPIRIGGYLEAAGRWQRVDGATDELGIELTRFNLLTSTDLRGRVMVTGEIELEEGGEELVLELAQVDVRMHPAANLRGGILLLPLGRFNLSHDGPGNDLPSRPVMATDLLGSALSQPGFGMVGRFEARHGERLTYEAYAVTGYDEGILFSAAGGTRLTSGRFNREDSNASPAWVGRLEWSPSFAHTVGLSGYTGAYNVHRIEGVVIDVARHVSVAVADLGMRVAGCRLAGEVALVNVGIPPSLVGIYATRQAGMFAQLSRPLGRTSLTDAPGSGFTAVVRADLVDFDRDLRGDSTRGLTFGLAWRPIPESGVKLSFTRSEERDRFNNRSTFAGFVLGLTSWF